MAEEIISEPSGALDIKRLWHKANTPEARRRIMARIVSLGTIGPAIVAHKQMRRMIAGIADDGERALAAHDYVTVVVDLASPETISFDMDHVLIEEARVVCTSRFFDTPLALFGAYIYVAAASRAKPDLVKARDVVALVPKADLGPNVHAWCWKQIYEVSGCICDAERYVAAGGNGQDLGLKNPGEARSDIVENPSPAMAAGG